MEVLTTNEEVHDAGQDEVELGNNSYNPPSINAKKRNKKNRRKKKDVSIIEANNIENSTSDELLNINSTLLTFQEWLHSLNWEEMVASMEITVVRNDKKTSSQTPTMSQNELELVHEMIRLLPCPTTPIHPRAVGSLNNVSPVDDGRNQEALKQKFQLNQPRLFQFLERKLSTFGSDNEPDFASEGYASHVHNKELLIGTKSITTRNANVGKRKVPRNQRKVTRMGQEISNPHSRNGYSEFHSSVKLYDVIARKFVLDDGERLSIGCTKDQQVADQAILQCSVWMYENDPSDYQKPSKIRFTIDNNHAIEIRQQLGLKDDNITIQQLTLRILKISTRGNFGAIESPHEDIKENSMLIAPWFKPQERWFSLSMYLASCFEVALWRSYRIYEAQYQNPVHRLDKQISPIIKSHSLGTEYPGINREMKELILYKSICQVSKNSFLEEKKMLQVGLKPLLLRRSHFRNLLEPNKNKSLKDFQLLTIKNEAETPSFDLNLVFTSPLLELDTTKQKWKCTVRQRYCELMNEAVRELVVQELLNQLKQEEINNNSNDSDRTHKIVNRKVRSFATGEEQLTTNGHDKSPTSKRKVKRKSRSKEATHDGGHLKIDGDDNQPINSLDPTETKSSDLPSEEILMIDSATSSSSDEGYESRARLPQQHENYLYEFPSNDNITPRTRNRNTVMALSIVDEIFDNVYKQIGVDISQPTDGTDVSDKDFESTNEPLFHMVGRNGNLKKDEIEASHQPHSAEFLDAQNAQSRTESIEVNNSPIETNDSWKSKIEDIHSNNHSDLIKTEIHSLKNKEKIDTITINKTADVESEQSNIDRDTHENDSLVLALQTAESDICYKVRNHQDKTEVKQSGPFVEESCSTLKRSNLGSANLPHESLEYVLGSTWGSGTFRTASQSEKINIDFRSSMEQIKDGYVVNQNRNPSEAIPRDSELRISSDAATASFPPIDDKIELENDFPIRSHEKLMPENDQAICPARNYSPNTEQHYHEKSYSPDVNGSKVLSANALVIAKSPSLGPKSSPSLTSLAAKSSCFEDDRFGQIKMSFSDDHPPILSCGSEPISCQRSASISNASHENKSRNQSRDPSKKKVPSPRQFRTTDITSTRTSSTSNLASSRSRDDEDLKMNGNKLSRRSADALSNYRIPIKHDFVSRDDQDIHPSAKRDTPARYPSYRSVIPKSNSHLNGSLSSIKTSLSESFRNNNRAFNLESTVSRHNETDFTTQSETGIEDQTDYQNCFESIRSPANEEFDNNTVTKDCSTTISSALSQKDRDEILLLREERNSYRDMCLTLGAEVAKLKNMLAAQRNTTKHHSMEYTPGNFQYASRNIFVRDPESISHHAFQIAPRARTLAAMSDTGCVDHESLVSEDEVANSKMLAGESLRQSSSLTITGSDASLDHTSGHNAMHMPFIGINPTRDGPDPVSLNGMQSRLTKDILQFLESISNQLRRQNPKRDLVVERMTKLVNTLWPRAQVKLYGSHVTGLCLPSSDLDFVVCLPAVHKNTIAIAAGELEVRNAINESSQKLLARRLKGESWIDPRSMKLIERTVVPVIKVSTKDSKARALQLDITFDAPGHHGREAVVMVTQIADELPMIRPITIVLKKFLLDRGLLTAYTGGLSSYCLFLMVARYLQEQPSSWGDCGALLMGFLDFYGNHFDPRTTGISVRHRLYFERPNYAASRGHLTGQAVWNPIVHARPPLLGLGNPSFRRNSFSDRGSIDGARAFGTMFPPGNIPTTNTASQIFNPSHHDSTDQSAFDHGMPYTFDPLFVEDPLSETNNVGRNAFRIFQVQRAFSDAHRALVAALEWDMQSDGELQDSNEYPLLKCLLQSEDTVFDL